MKAHRQLKILDIIRRQDVHTQGELASLLRREGVRATQATVSRDIKDLGLVKAVTADGRHRYAAPDSGGERLAADRMRRYLRDVVVSVDAAENLVVVKTVEGGAMAVAAALDSLGWPEVIGTLGGDDTILLIMRQRDQVQVVLGRLADLAR